MNALVQAGGPGRAGLALRADHRHRLDLRLPGRAPGLPVGAAGAAVHRAVVRLGAGGVPARAGGDVRLERPARWRPRSQRRMARLLGVFVAASLYLVAVYHLTNLYFARQGAFEAFILLRRRHLSAAVLGRLRARRLGARRWCCCSTRGCGSERGMLAAAALVVARRLRLAVRLHHRRPGLPAGDLPRLRGQQQLRRRRGRALRAVAARIAARRRRRWARPSCSPPSACACFDFLPQDDLAAAAKP